MFDHLKKMNEAKKKKKKENVIQIVNTVSLTDVIMKPYRHAGECHI